MNTEPKPPSRTGAWITFIIRIILGLAFIDGVFTETGIWTAIFAFLILTGSEVHGFVLRKTIRDIHGLYAAVMVSLSQSHNVFNELFHPLDSSGNPKEDPDNPDKG